MKTARTSLPLTFRYRLIEKLMRSVKAGESISVIGVASVGKSNLVHALQQADIQAAHLGRLQAGELFVWVDSNDLTEIGPWHFLELLLYRLSTQVRNINLSTEIVSHLDELHEKLLARENVTLAQRCFEEAIRWLCQAHQFKVVLLLDEFDLLLQELPARLFINLRSLRDKNKYGLVYILFLREAFEALRPALHEIEAFAELFQANIHYLTPYDLPGTESMLARLCERRRIEWPVRYTLPLFELSGGHSGLLKVMFGKVLPQIETGQGLHTDFLTADPEIADECQKIWACLADEEKRFLGQLVRPDVSGQSHKASPKAVDQLLKKGLLRLSDHGLQPFSPLFADFVRRTQAVPEYRPHFVFDITSRTCRINNNEIALPALPARLLELLYNNRGKPCRRVEILQYLYPDEDHSQLRRISDDPRLYDVVKNLRKKIEPDPQKPRYVKTVRGMGFKLDI